MKIKKYRLGILMGGFLIALGAFPVGYFYDVTVGLFMFPLAFMSIVIFILTGGIEDKGPAPH